MASLNTFLKDENKKINSQKDVIFHFIPARKPKAPCKITNNKRSHNEMAIPLKFSIFLIFEKRRRTIDIIPMNIWIGKEKKITPIIAQFSE